MKHNFRASLLFLLLAFYGCSNSSDGGADELAAIVAEVNKKCPQVIDAETRIDGLEFREPNTIRYKYTLLNMNAQVLDTHQFYLAMWPGILSTIRVSADMKKLRDNNATVEYYYQDKAAKPVYLFTVRPQDYR